MSCTQTLKTTKIETRRVSFCPMQGLGNPSFKESTLMNGFFKLVTIAVKNTSYKIVAVIKPIFWNGAVIIQHLHQGGIQISYKGYPDSWFEFSYFHNSR